MHIELPPLPAKATVATSWPSEPPPNSPFTGDGLLLLLNDAAQRATDTLAVGAPSGLHADPIVDLARRGASAMPAPLRKALAKSAGLTAGALDQQATAYRIGGAEAVHMLNEPGWSPSPTDVERAVIQIRTHHGIEPSVRSNSFTIDHIRYTLNQAGRWSRFERKSGRWRLAAPMADSIKEVLADG